MESDWIITVAVVTVFGIAVCFFDRGSRPFAGILEGLSLVLAAVAFVAFKVWGTLLTDAASLAFMALAWVLARLRRTTQAPESNSPTGPKQADLSS